MDMKKWAFMITLKPECLKQTIDIAKRIKERGYVVLTVFSNLGTIVGLCDEKEGLNIEEAKRLSFMDRTMMYGTSEVAQEWNP